MPEKPGYSKDLWNILFQKHYKDEILGLAAVFTKNTLKIDFNYLERAWGLVGETTTSAIEYLINQSSGKRIRRQGRC